MQAAALQAVFQNIQAAREAATASTEFSSGVMTSLKKYAAILELLETRLLSDNYSVRQSQPQKHFRPLDCWFIAVLHL